MHALTLASAPPLPPYSVVIPCYNVEGLVGEAVASALAQTHAPAEVVCVDDGSADGTLAVLRALEAAHRPVRVLAQAHAGAPAARNAGLRATRGPWVQFLDADDVLAPGKAARQLRLAREAGADLVAGAAREETASGGHRVREAGGPPWRALVMDRLGITSANLFRRKAVAAAGGWAEALPCGQEYDLMFRMLCGGARVAYDAVPDTEVRYREGSVGKSEEAFVVGMSLRARALAAGRARGVFGGAEEAALLNFFFRWIRAHHAHRPDEALAMHRLLIPASFVPVPAGNTTRAYALAYRVLGFERAEWLRRLTGREHASKGARSSSRVPTGATLTGVQGQS